MAEEQNADALTTGQQLVLHLLQVLRQHGCPHLTFAETLEWLDQRLTAGEEYARMVAAPGPFQPRVGPPDPHGQLFTRMRATQEQSAQQAMILMADDLQRALEENARLRASLKTMATQREIGYRLERAAEEEC